MMLQDVHLIIPVFALSFKERNNVEYTHPLEGVCAILYFICRAQCIPTLRLNQRFLYYLCAFSRYTKDGVSKLFCKEKRTQRL